MRAAMCGLLTRARRMRLSATSTETAFGCVSSAVMAGTIAKSVSPTLETTRFGANVTTGDALIGYLWRIDPLILKLFMGASFSDHQIRPIDENNQVQGPEFGAKVVAEF